MLLKEHISNIPIELTSDKATNKEPISLAERIRRRAKRQRGVLLFLFGLLLLATAYVVAFYISPETVGGGWKYLMIGFTAEVINGTLGMAYGVTTTTLLLSSGIAPAITLIIVHILEVFTAGATGLIHLKMGNVNKRLFSKLLLPGITGAFAGALLLYAFKSYTHIIKSTVSGYTLILGIVILYRAIRRIRKGRKIKNIFPLGIIAGFLDSIGGGGWGTIVSSTLIADGRDARYTIGSVILSRFFVAFASAVSLILLLGFVQWSVVGWLIAGGLAASPIGPYLAKHIPVKITMILVAITVILMSLKQIIF